MAAQRLGMAQRCEAREAAWMAYYVKGEAGYLESIGKRGVPKTTRDRSVAARFRTLDAAWKAAKQVADADPKRGGGFRAVSEDAAE